MKEFFENHKKIILIVGGALIFVAIILFIILNIPKDFAQVKLQNVEELRKVGISNDSIYRIKIAVHANLVQNKLIAEDATVDDVAIREGTVASYEEENGKDIQKNITFLADIDSIKQTYLVTVADTEKDLTDLAVQVSCPNVELMKYPESTCSGVYGSSSKSVRNNIPHEMKLDSGEKILVKNIEPTRGGQQLLHIYLYSCDSANPPSEKAREVVHDWVKKLGDPQVEYYTYNVRTGYCEGDAI